MIPSDLLVNAVIAERRRQADQERLARTALARHRRSGPGPRIRLVISRLNLMRNATRGGLRSGQA